MKIIYALPVQQKIAPFRDITYDHNTRSVLAPSYLGFLWSWRHHTIFDAITNQNITCAKSSQLDTNAIDSLDIVPEFILWLGHCQVSKDDWTEQHCTGSCGRRVLLDVGHAQTVCRNILEPVIPTRSLVWSSDLHLCTRWILLSILIREAQVWSYQAMTSWDSCQKNATYFSVFIPSFRSVNNGPPSWDTSGTQVKLPC